MPVPTPFHSRTSELCTSYRWKDWSGYHAVCSFDVCHQPEYFALRHAAGLLDISPLCKYRVTGRGAADFLAWVMTRDIRQLKVGRVTYSCLCDHRGKIVDDGTVARLAENDYRVTTGSPTWSWFADHARGFDVELRDESNEVAALALQGPTSKAMLQTVTDLDLDGLRFFQIKCAQIHGASVEISRTGYTGDLGYEIWMQPDDALPIWDALMTAGRDYGLLPIGLDALDMTRVEAGFVLQGIDYYSALTTRVKSRLSSPLELGLAWTVALNRDPFLGQAALRDEARVGPRWSLVGLEMDWDRIQALYQEAGLPPHLDPSAWRTAVPVFQSKNQIGQATSGTWSPILKKNLALASVHSACAAVGTKLEIEFTVEFRRHTVPAVVVKTPFFDPDRKRA